MSTPRRKTLEHHLLRALVHRWRQHLPQSDQRAFAYFLMDVLHDALKRLDDDETSETGKKPA